MSSLFPTDRLVESTFEARLSALFDDARTGLGVSAIALIELAALDGRVAPLWRQWSPREIQLSKISMDQFRALMKGPWRRSTLDGDVAHLCGDLGDQVATIVPLTLSPRFAAAPDAAVLLFHDDSSAELTRLSEFVRCLEHGLSTDRRHRLAHTIFQAVEQAPDAIEITDGAAQLLYANPAWEHTFAYSAADAIGQTVGRLFREPIKPLHDSAFYQFTMATLSDGQPWMGALACRTGDGRRVFCEVSVSPFVADEQAFRGNFAIRRDLSHRAGRDEALAVAHSEFRAVLLAIPDGVVVLRNGSIYFANRAFLDMVGLTEGETIGQEYAAFVHPDDREDFLREYERRVTRVRILRKDGSARFAEISTAGAVSFEGTQATILLSRDTTDYRVAQEQLSRAEKLSALGALAAGVAHEINNPLAYVGLNLKYLRDAGNLSAAGADVLNEAIEGSERIRQIVLELKGYSGNDAPGSPDSVDLTKALTSAMNIAQNEIRHRARLVRDLEENLFAVVREGQIVQVFVNVLVNAAQAIPASATKDHVIAVRSRATADNDVEIRISDTGVGISQSALPHVFDPFATGKRRGEGSGLGLAISKRIVEEFGGRIAIESIVGKGTTVTIGLPRAAPRRSSVGPPSYPPSGRLARIGSTSARVLVVDDDFPVARSIKRMLSVHDVAIARGAHDALELMAAGKEFDVILCDLMMPGMAGPDFYEEVCRRYPRMERSFVFMTGGAFTDSAREFEEMVQCPVVAKPFDLAIVLGFIEDLTRKKRSRSASR